MPGGCQKQNVVAKTGLRRLRALKLGQASLGPRPPQPDPSGMCTQLKRSQAYLAAAQQQAWRSTAQHSVSCRACSLAEAFLAVHRWGQFWVASARHSLFTAVQATARRMAAAGVGAALLDKVSLFGGRLRGLRRAPSLKRRDWPAMPAGTAQQPRQQLPLFPAALTFYPAGECGGAGREAVRG